MAAVALGSRAGISGPRFQQAGIVAIAESLLLILSLYTGALGLLPSYPAVAVAFVVWCIAPGWLVQRALVRGWPMGFVERVALALVFSVALAAVPGLLALSLHWSLQWFAVAYALLASAAGGLSLLWSQEEEEESEAAGPQSRFSNTPLLVIVALAALAIASSPWWAGDKLARDSDDWVYLGYVNEYLHADGIDASEAPSGGGSYQRMRANVWVVQQALLADAADVEPEGLLMSYLPPLLILLALAGTYTLAMGLFRNATVALLAVIVQLGYALLDLSPHEGYGRNLLLRIGEDKMVAAFVLLPLGLLLATRFVAGRNGRLFLAVVATGLALVVVHPLGLLFLGMAVGGFALVRAASMRTWEPLLSAVMVLAPLAALGGIAAGYLSQEDAVVTGPFDSRLLFREEIHVVQVSSNLSMGNFHLVLHPLMLAALALAPLLWWRSRRDAGSQLLLGVTLTFALLFFFPPLATELGKKMSWTAVWRMTWIVPVGVILALGCYRALEWLADSRSTVLRPLARPGVLYVAPVAIAFAALAGALVIQEHYQAVDKGAFYSRTSSTALLPWTDRSIALGGLDRAFSGDWRLRGQTRRMVWDLKATIPPRSRVLANPDISVYLPGILPGVDVVAALGSGTAEERELAATFYQSTLERGELNEELARMGIDYAVLESGTSAELGLRKVTTLLALDFQPRLGQPEQVSFGERGIFTAWAFDGAVREEVGGQRFMVPPDISAEDRTLDFELVVAPARAAEHNGNVVMVISYHKVGDERSTKNAVVNIPVVGGAGFGQPLTRRRAPLTEFDPGAEYELIVWRLADDENDTYPDDALFISIGVQYWPEGLREVTGTRYSVLQVAR